MKSYDEITNQILETAEVRTVKLKRIRYAATTAVVCVCSVIGGAAFMQLEKPEITPSDLYSEESNDSLHSASDSSTEETIETTQEPTTETTTAPVTTPAPASDTAPLTTYTMESAPEEEITPTEIVPIFAESGAPVIVTSIPGETHNAQTMKHTSLTARTPETTAVTTAETVPETEETAPVETEVTTQAETKEFVETISTDGNELPPETPAVSDTSPEELPTEATEQPEQPQEETPPPVPLDKWSFLYELYFNGELPFDLEVLTEDMDEEEIISLFPELFTEETE